MSSIKTTFFIVDALNAAALAARRASFSVPFPHDLGEYLLIGAVAIVTPLTITHALIQRQTPNTNHESSLTKNLNCLSLTTRRDSAQYAELDFSRTSNTEGSNESGGHFSVCLRSISSRLFSHPRILSPRDREASNLPSFSIVSLRSPRAPRLTTKFLPEREIRQRFLLNESPHNCSHPAWGPTTEWIRQSATWSRNGCPPIFLFFQNHRRDAARPAKTSLFPRFAPVQQIL
jgi:hypothetical protein